MSLYNIKGTSMELIKFHSNDVDRRSDTVTEIN